MTPASHGAAAPLCTGGSFGMNRAVFRLLASLAILCAVASAFLYGKVREDAALVRAFVEDATRGIPRSDRESLAIAVARKAHHRTNRVITADDLSLYEQLESASPFNVSTAVSLRHGVYGLVGHSQVGPCGTMTRVTMEALRQLGIPARKLQLLPVTPEGGHTMLEFQSGGRWLVLSPSDDAFVWRRPDGRIATLEDIRSDQAIFSQVYARFPNFPYRFDQAAHIRWAKLPAPVRGFFRIVLGKQGYENAFTPPIYDRPRELFLWTSLAACGVFSLAAVVIRATMRRRETQAMQWSAAA